MRRRSTASGRGCRGCEPRSRRRPAVDPRPAGVVALGAMRATRPPDERRARHEKTGEWPQPTLSALLDDRVGRTPDAVYLIEGLREGGRTFTFADLKTRAD